jgi:uncharacterized repeat protein (TIGR02543 family)
MALWVKKNGTSSGWVEANKVWVKDSSTWSAVKKIWVKAASGWTLFWPKVGPSTTTSPFFSNNSSGTSPVVGPTILYGSTIYGQRGVWDGNGYTIASYSYKLESSTSSSVGSGPYTTIISETPMTTSSQELNLNTSQYDGKYLIFTVKATVSGSISSTDNTDSGGTRFAVIRYAPRQASGITPLVSSTVTNSTSTLSGGILISRGAPITLNYSNSWDGADLYLPDSTRNSIKWYSSTNGSYITISEIEANATLISSGVTIASPTNDGTYYSTSSTYITGSTIPNGTYYYIVDSQQNSNTDYYISGAISKITTYGPIKTSPTPTTQPTLTAITPAGYGGNQNSFTVGCTVSGNTGYWNPTPNGSNPVISAFKYSTTSSIANQSNWNLFNLGSNGSGTIYGINDSTQGQTHIFTLPGVIYDLGGTTYASEGKYLEYSISVENGAGALASDYYTNSQIIYPTPKPLSVTSVTDTSTNIISFTYAGLYSTYSVQLQYSTNNSNWTTLSPSYLLSGSLVGTITNVSVPSTSVLAYYRLLCSNQDGVTTTSSGSYTFYPKPSAPIITGYGVTANQWGVLINFGSNTGSVNVEWGSSNGSYPYTLGLTNTSGTTLSPVGPFASNTTYYWKATPYYGANLTLRAGDSIYGSVKTLALYTITYDPNGGTVSPTSTLVTEGNSTTLPTPSRPGGFTFNGWYTLSSGGTRVGGAGDSYTPSGSTTSITLYAQWTAIYPGTPTVTNYGVTGSQWGIKVDFGTNTGSVAVNYGTSSGSYTNSLGSSNTSGSTFSPVGPFSAGTTFYWQVISYYSPGVSGNSTTTTGTTTTDCLITYNAAGGSVTPSIVYAAYGAIITLPTPTQSGYTFNGWYTAYSGGTRVGGAGDSYTVSGNITLYAQWTLIVPSAPTVTNNTSTTSQWSVNVTFGSNTSSVVVRYGTSAGSYGTTAGTTNTSGSNVSPIGPFLSNTTYYWQATPYYGTNGTGTAGTATTGSVRTLASYTVTYNANSGTVSPTSAPVTEGNSVTLPTPTRSGYTFNGWYTASTGGTSIGAAGDSYTPTASITIYAQWTIIPVTPTITTPTYTGITQTAGTINWTSTNQASYALDGSFTDTGTTGTSVSKTGLTASTTYSGNVTVTSSTGHTASKAYSFTTSSPPATPGAPTITDSTTSSFTAQVTITFGTNTTKVALGWGTSAALAASATKTDYTTTGATSSPVGPNSPSTTYYYNAIPYNSTTAGSTVTGSVTTPALPNISLITAQGNGVSGTTPLGVTFVITGTRLGSVEYEIFARDTTTSAYSRTNIGTAAGPSPVTITTSGFIGASPDQYYIVATPRSGARTGSGATSGTGDSGTARSTSAIPKNNLIVTTPAQVYP